jgi:hypothetical protein
MPVALWLLPLMAVPLWLLPLMAGGLVFLQPEWGRTVLSLIMLSRLGIGQGDRPKKQQQKGCAGKSNAFHEDYLLG